MLGLLYWQFVLQAAEAGFEDGAGASTSRRSRPTSKLENDIPKFEKLKARMTRLKRIIDENQKALPTEAELPAFFEMLNRKVAESGVEVDRAAARRRADDRDVRQGAGRVSR